MLRAANIVRVCAMAVLLACAVGGLAQAGTSVDVTLPRASSLPQQSNFGLALKVESDWVQGYGYRPITATLAGLKVGHDRTLTLELGLGDWMNHNYVVVPMSITLPAGETRVSQTALVPQLPTAQLVNIVTRIGGREIEELTARGNSLGSGQYWGGDSGVPRILFVSDSEPNVRSWKFLGEVPFLSYGNAINFQHFPDVFAFVHRQPDDLLDAWLAYSALDLIFLDRGTAEQLAAKQPRVWQALCQWMRCGGSLCLYGAGSQWDGLEPIERLVAAPVAAEDAAKDLRGWETPTTVTFDQVVVPGIEQNLLNEAIQSGNSNATSPAAPQRPAEPPFAWKAVGLGRVVAFSSADPFPGEEATWRWLLASLDPSASRWTTRMGTIPDGENAQFNEFLIADVGLPPIRTYRVLITLFVIGIGPLNYLLLRRWGRLHLFLFTVPLAALITSGGLLSYALLSDGLQSRLRSRSLTLLDQQFAQATTAARLSYYVGVAPAGGMNFPLDTLVLPLELTPAARGSGGRTRHMNWGETQNLSRGWLLSRTPTQFMTLRSQPSQHGLDFSATDSKDRSITNRLATPIQQLLVRDESGQWLRATGVAPDASAILRPLNSEDQVQAATKEFVDTLRKNAPALPDSMTAFGSRENWLWFGRMYRYFDQSSIDPTGNLLDVHLAALVAELRSGSLANRSYVALVEHPPQLATGIPTPTESQSTHVILGTW